MSGEAGIWHSDRVTSPAEQVLHDHPTGCETSFQGNIDGMSPGSSGDIGK